MLLALNREGADLSPGEQQPSDAGKGKETNSPLDTPERTQSC